MRNKFIKDNSAILVMTIKNNDFVELDYTGRLKDTNDVFDTTKEDVAKANKLFNPKATYKPVIICVGEAMILKGLDDQLLGKELGAHTVALSADNAFGKKDAKLIRLVPLRRFAEQGIQPMPGLQVNIDGTMGTVRAISGGRIILDFNHPLAGKDVLYEVTLTRLVSDTAEKIKAWLHLVFGMNAEVTVTGDTAVAVVQKEIPAMIAVEATKKLAEITGIRTVEFTTKKAEVKATEAAPAASKPKTPEAKADTTPLMPTEGPQESRRL